MPWIAERADEIGWERLEALLGEAVAAARQRICATPRRVLLLPPAEPKAKSFRKTGKKRCVALSVSTGWCIYTACPKFKARIFCASITATM